MYKKYMRFAGQIRHRISFFHNIKCVIYIPTYKAYYYYIDTDRVVKGIIPIYYVLWQSLSTLGIYFILYYTIPNNVQCFISIIYIIYIIRIRKHFLYPLTLPNILYQAASVLLRFLLREKI